MAQDVARLGRGCRKCDSQAVRRKYEALARAREFPQTRGFAGQTKPIKNRLLRNRA